MSVRPKPKEEIYLLHHDGKVLVEMLSLKPKGITVIMNPKVKLVFK